MSEYGLRSLRGSCPELRALSIRDASLSSVAFRTVCVPCMGVLKGGIPLHVKASGVGGAWVHA